MIGRPHLSDLNADQGKVAVTRRAFDVHLEDFYGNLLQLNSIKCQLHFMGTNAVNSLAHTPANI